MSNDIQFIDGLIVKAPHEKAPEYVKAKLSIKREDLIAWLQGRSEEWINGEVKVSKSGNWYSAVDDWKPNGGQRSEAPPPQRQSAPADFDDDIPF